MQQILKPQTGAGFELKKGQKLKVIDLQGEQVSDLFCFRKADPTDALSSGRSVDYAETIFFTAGHVLHSQKGLPVLRILEDTCGRHDFLVTPCSLQMFQMIHQNDRYHPSCLENLEKAFTGTGVNLNQIGTSFNIFMNVPVSDQGKISVKCPLSKPGDFIVFEALEDLIVGLTACSDEGTNNGSCKSIAYEIQS